MNWPIIEAGFTENRNLNLVRYAGVDYETEIPGKVRIGARIVSEASGSEMNALFEQ